MTEYAIVDNGGGGPHGGNAVGRGERQYPKLYNTLGQRIDVRSEDYIEGVEKRKKVAWGTTSLPPLGWNHGKPDGTRMVGWTLTQKNKSKIVAQHAFSINPQSINRSNTSRNQLFATQAHFYVDDFGPGSTTIQISQFVAHGRASRRANGGDGRATMREDVLRFYDVIYLQATANPGLFDVYFYDNHLYEVGNGSVPEKVYFPSGGVSLLRSVQQHNVWQLQITMGTLIAPPSKGKRAPQVAGQPPTRQYQVRQGDTLMKIASQLAGGHATHQRRLQLQQQIIALTAKYGEDDIRKARVIPVFNTAGIQTGSTQVSRLHLATGEKIILPAG